MELKFMSEAGEAINADRLNRTFMELKFEKLNALHLLLS